ncbi:MAG: altronate dehydratase family protein [Defluviitaleaceae bacterium]|nr:altronate dehydratase family protein [Defluviitaleaceae bacterium]MCL2835373.1 altronate dehydratase family protein [Defluviitaleaceae bacterium]
MDFIKLHENDNVAVNIKPGDPDFGHKTALADIPPGENVIKYGYPIGLAIMTIKSGEKVHIHNIKTKLAGELEYTYNPKPSKLAPREPGIFMGFKRANGKVGIRNEIWIIPTVGCVNGTAASVVRKAEAMLYGSVQGCYAFPHPLGCSQLADDHETTKKALCGLVKHPNAGGALVLGLGCENNCMDGMMEMLGDVDRNRVKFLVCQDHEDEEAAALALIGELIKAAAADKREPVPTSELVIGLKCGGSDGLSGITANPLTGAFSDILIAEGGSAILTEVPEMFGAETILMDRCVNEEIFNKTVAMINGFKAYYANHGLPVYENPSPGNKDGGISTLEDKSLGCTQKAGTADVVDVLPYGAALTVKGLNLLESPGNDLVAATALAASGAHLVLFTTGRGTPFGSPVPTVKISSNTPLYDKKRNWIDFDAGPLISGETMEIMAERFYKYVIRLANGEEQTKTEQNGIRDMAIFKNGVTL